MKRIFFTILFLTALASQALALSAADRLLGVISVSPAYTFPMYGVVDTFSGTDGTTPPDSGWSNAYGGLKLMGNAATGTAAGDNNLAQWNTAITAGQGEFYISIPTLPTGNNADALWLVFATTGGAGHGYCIRWSQTSGTDTLGLYKWVNGWIGAQIGSSISQEISAGDSIGLYSVGATKRIEYKASGGGSYSKLGSDFTDSTYSDMTYFMVQVYGSVIRVDNPGGGAL